MYAVKETNLIAKGNPTHYIPAKDYADACNILRIERETLNLSWTENEDYTAEIVEVGKDFDFANQPEWN